MSSGNSIMLHTVLADRRFWIFYVLGCVTALLWVGFSAAQGVMFFIGLSVSLIVFVVSIILCMMLITEMRNNASPGTMSLSNQASD